MNIIRRCFLLLILCTFVLRLSAKEFKFNIPVNTMAGQDEYTIFYDSSNQYLQVFKKGYVYFMFMPLPSEVKSIVEGEFLVKPYVTTTNTSIGGEIGEIVFLKDGKFLFGLYINPKETPNLKLHESYLLLNNQAGKIEKLESCGLNNETSTLFKDLQKKSEPYPSFSQADIKISEYVDKIFGKIDPFAMVNTHWDEYSALLSSAFLKEPKVNYISNEIRSYFIYEPNMEIAGKRPDTSKVYRTLGGYPSLSWSYEYEFKNKKEAVAFYQTLIKKLNEEGKYHITKSKYADGDSGTYEQTFPMDSDSKFEICVHYGPFSGTKSGMYYTSIGGIIWNK